MTERLAETTASISIWAPFIYQYSIGGFLFLIGLAVILRSRACDLHRGCDRFWFAALLVGMGLYFAVHLTVYLLAIHMLPNVRGVAG